MMYHFTGLGLNLGTLSHMSSAETRSISAENPTGEKGRGGMAEPADLTDPDLIAAVADLGRGWKVRPYITIPPGETAVLADIQGPGALQSMWFGGVNDRNKILRIFWEDQVLPSVECPINDFFALPWLTERDAFTRGPQVMVNSAPVVVNPNRALNCFWEMPFRKRCQLTLENLHPSAPMITYYQINYTLTDVPDECAYFHAQFRRINPLPYKQVYTILDGVAGQGHYVGTAMGWGINNNRWWGEGEIKFYIDGDDEFPTICGTGTEDYFGGSYNWDIDGQYVTYSTAFMGMHQVIRPDGLYKAQHRHAMYRWHIMDPIRFKHDLRVMIQALGWRDGKRYLPGQHDISSVAYWYQSLPTLPFPKLPDRDALEVT
jgi:hypothetical protein